MSLIVMLMPVFVTPVVLTRAVLAFNIFCSLISPPSHVGAFQFVVCHLDTRRFEARCYADCSVGAYCLDVLLLVVLASVNLTSIGLAPATVISVKIFLARVTLATVTLAPVNLVPDLLLQNYYQLSQTNAFN